MNPEKPMTPREELEMRVTALLMGELPPEEAAALEQKMAADLDLQDLHRRLRRAMELVKEASALPEPPGLPVPVQLSSERRAHLLAHFKTPAALPAPAPVVELPRKNWSWVLPLGLAASLIALLGGSLFLNGFTQSKASRADGLLAEADYLSVPEAPAAGVNHWNMQPGPGRGWGESEVGQRARGLAEKEDATAVQMGRSLGDSAGDKMNRYAVVTPPALPAQPADGAPLPNLSTSNAENAPAELNTVREMITSLADSPVPATAAPAPGRAGGGAVSAGRPALAAFKAPPPPLAQSGPPAKDEKKAVLGVEPLAEETLRMAGEEPAAELLPQLAEARAAHTDLFSDHPDGSAMTADAQKPAESKVTLSSALFGGQVAPTPARESEVLARNYQSNENFLFDGAAAAAQPADRSQLAGKADHFGLAGDAAIDRLATVAGTRHRSENAQAAEGTNLSLGFDVGKNLADESALRGQSAERSNDMKEELVQQLQNQAEVASAMAAEMPLEIVSPDDARLAAGLDASVPASAPVESAELASVRGTIQPEGERGGFAGGRIAPPQKPANVYFRDGADLNDAAESRRGLEVLSAADGKTEKRVAGRIQSFTDEDRAKQNLNTATEEAKPVAPMQPAEAKGNALSAAGAMIIGDDSSLARLGEPAAQSRKDVPRVLNRPADKPVELAKRKKELVEQVLKEKDGEEAAPQPRLPAPEPQPEIATSANAFSTFSLNVSDVAFKLAAASLEQGKMPELATVRSEEFINAFDYRDPEPAPGAPLAFTSELARYPFAQNRDLLRLSVKTAAAGRQPGRALNLVLLLDNSGSMERADRVRILQEALRVLSAQLQPQDKLSVVTFARTPRLWADGLAGDKAAEVTARVGEITPQGGTNLAAALDLGYATALKHYRPGSINRVVVLTDGAANLGDVNPDALKQKVETNRQKGVALDCFGIGWEGYDDAVLEALSRNGDGRYGFINTPEEAATNFATQLAGALRVAASDVKVQVEFNPRRVTAYRQIGYAKHQLKKEQFRDNTVDAAEIGAAESGNALYALEVNPRGVGDLATVRVRFKVPGTSDYKEHEWTVPFTTSTPPLEQASPALRLAGTASAFSEWLVASPHAGEVTTDQLLGLLNGVPAIYGADPRPQKLEWMIRTAKSVSGR